MVGQILKINWDKGFGFLNSCSQNYYFKIRNCIHNVNVGDKVAFEINETNNGPEAIAVRKVYENKLGTLFIPRINFHHIHLKLEEFLPLIIDKIKIDLNKDIIEFEYEFPYVYNIIR
jgi:exoribonuclease II